MKSYLSLVFEYARVHKKKNRLTLICITISVMLVTAVFGMADMSIKAQINEYIRQKGNFHAIITGIPDDVAEQINNRDDVKVSDWLGMAADTSYLEKELIIQSCGQEFAQEMNLKLAEGRYPEAEDEALIDRPGLEQFGLSIGDTMSVDYGEGIVRNYTITGIFNDFSSLKRSDVHGLMLSTAGMRALPTEKYSQYYYMQFKNGVNVNKSLDEIRREYKLSDDQVTANNMLLGLMGQSKDSALLGVYLTAAILFILILLAGIFMIAGSFNMSVSERTQFFGLLRCLGATKKQIKRYIRLEGLVYCLKAIPLGLLSGSIVVWMSVYFLNALNSKYLPQMPALNLSLPGIAAGAFMGLLVVMVASASPAKNAARVSPQAAVTGNLGRLGSQFDGKSSSLRLFKVDTAMGLKHAFANKKSMLLIGGSFAVSIILFMCFTILITFMNSAMKPLKPYAPDISVKGAQDGVYLSQSLKEELAALPHIKKIYGRSFLYDIPAEDKRGSGTATLISYDEPQFEWARRMLTDGSITAVRDGTGVLVDYGYLENFGWKIGDTITLYVNDQPHDVQISGIVSDVPFDDNGGWIIVCSENTFTAITGISDYTIIDMQVDSDISLQVRELISDDMLMLDSQQSNKEVRASYYTMAVFIYGFLLVIALIALINIINTVNSSVSGRIANYGVMRAVGMSGNQLRRMVWAESAAYAITGGIAGGTLGMVLHRFLFETVITANWGQPWQPPILALTITVSASVLTAFIAIIAPTKKIRDMDIVNVVNAD